MATRSDLLRIASDFLAASGSGPLVRLVVEAQGTWIELDANELPSRPDALPSAERKLLAQIGHEPRKAKAIARAAGYKWGSHVYGALRSLERRGLIHKAAGGGYVLS